MAGATVEVRFGEWFQEGIALFRGSAWTLILVSLLAGILSLLSCGVLAGPMAAGLSLIVLALVDGRRPAPSVEDLFSGFRFFLPSLLLWLLAAAAMLLAGVTLGNVPLIGGLLTSLFSVAVSAFPMFAQFLIVDRGRNAWQAVTESIDVVSANVWEFLGFGAVVSLLAGSGVVVCCVGMAATVPMAACVLGKAYRSVFPLSSPEAGPPAP